MQKTGSPIVLIGDGLPLQARTSQVQTKAESELIIPASGGKKLQEKCGHGMRGHICGRTWTWWRPLLPAGWGPKGDDNGQKRMHAKSSLRKPVEIRPTFEPNRVIRNRVRTKYAARW
jgi:hypothetical protein